MAHHYILYHYSIYFFVHKRTMNGSLCRNAENTSLKKSKIKNTIITSNIES